MTHLKIWLAPLLLLSLCLAQVPSTLLPVGSEAKRFLILDTDGKRVGLRDFVGVPKGPRMILLSFWSVTCVPCRLEMPLVQKWAATHPEDVTLLFVNLDSKADTEKIQEFLKQYGITGQVLLDFYQATGKNYQVCTASSCNVPTLYVLDSNSTIRMAVSGFDESHDLAGDLEALYQQIAAGATLAASPPDLNAVTTPNQAKFQVLHDALIRIPLDETAVRNGITRDQLIEIFKETEAAAKRQWNLP